MILPNKIMIGMWDWSCPGHDKSKSPIIQDVPHNRGHLATLFMPPMYPISMLNTNPINFSDAKLKIQVSFLRP